MRNESLSKRFERVLADMFLLFAVLFSPWWLVVLVVLFFIVYFRHFYEAFLAGILIDALYGTSGINFHGFRLFFGAGFLILLFAAQFLKEKMRIMRS